MLQTDTDEDGLRIIRRKRGDSDERRQTNGIGSFTPRKTGDARKLASLSEGSEGGAEKQLREKKHPERMKSINQK